MKKVFRMIGFVSVVLFLAACTFTVTTDLKKKEVEDMEKDMPNMAENMKDDDEIVAEEMDDNNAENEEQEHEAVQNTDPDEPIPPVSSSESEDEIVPTEDQPTEEAAVDIQVEIE